MTKFNICLLAAAVSLGMSTAYAAGSLDGLEMDVLDAGAKPARAASRIALPQSAGDERDYGAENAGSVSAATESAGDAVQGQGLSPDEPNGSGAGAISIVIDETPVKEPVDPEADGEASIEPAYPIDEESGDTKPDYVDGDVIDENETPTEDEQVFTILPYPYEGDSGAIGDDTAPGDESSPSEDFSEGGPFVDEAESDQSTSLDD